MMAAKEIQLPLSEFVARVDYDPSTGEFRWKERDISDFTGACSWRSWNAKHAGKPIKSKFEGYRAVILTLQGRKHVVLAHRLAVAMVTGDWPDRNVEIDHKNRQRLDNRYDNLRYASDSENCCNQSKRKNTSSVFRGVSYLAQAGTWMSSIDVQKQRLYIGTFATELEAAAAYNERARSLHGDFASLNDVPQSVVPKRLRRATGATGVRGVYPHPSGFVACAAKRYLGLFPSIEAATAARQAAITLGAIAC